LAGAGYQPDLQKKAGFRPEPEPEPNSGTALVLNSVYQKW